MMNATANLLYTTCLKALAILIETQAPIEQIVAMQVSINHLDMEILEGSISQETIHNAEFELIAADEYLKSLNEQKEQGAA
jgi:hypothetical protein